MKKIRKYLQDGDALFKIWMILIMVTMERQEVK